MENEDGTATVQVRFPVATHEKPMVPNNCDWYEVRHDLDEIHTAGLLNGIPEKVAFEIDTLLAVAKVHWEVLSYNVAHKINPPAQVEGPY